MKNLFITIVLILTVFSVSGKEYPKPSNVVTPSEKVYILSKFWQEVNYNFAFFGKNLTHAEWDKAYKESLDLALKTENDYQFYRVLQRFCTFLGDGHTTVYRPPISGYEGPKNPDDVYIPDLEGHQYEEGYMWFKELDGKILISDITKKLGQQLPLASQVIEVNGLPIEQYLSQQVMPYMQYGSEHIRRYHAVTYMLAGLPGQKFDIKVIKPDGAEASASLTLTPEKTYEDDYETFEYDPEFSDELVYLTWLEDGIVRVELNSFGDDKIVDDFKKALPELRKAKAIILDIRENGGGSTDIGSAILEYLTPDEYLYGSASRTRQHIAAYKAWGAFEDDKESKYYKMWKDDYYYELGADTLKVRPSLQERIVVPTVILTDYMTASAAEDFLVYTDNQKHMTRIGRKTFGSTGQPMSIPLGKGFGARICTKDDTYPDGRIFVGVGIAPHIEVVPTLDDMLNERDVMLEKAVEFLKTK
jgi:C-terminal processing protease CtpA/Prc